MNTTDWNYPVLVTNKLKASGIEAHVIRTNSGETLHEIGVEVTVHQNYSLTLFVNGRKHPKPFTVYSIGNLVSVAAKYVNCGQ